MEYLKLKRAKFVIRAIVLCLLLLFAKISKAETIDNQIKKFMESFEQGMKEEKPEISTTCFNVALQHLDELSIKSFYSPIVIYNMQVNLVKMGLGQNFVQSVEALLPISNNYPAFSNGLNIFKNGGYPELEPLDGYVAHKSKFKGAVPNSLISYNKKEYSNLANDRNKGTINNRDGYGKINVSDEKRQENIKSDVDENIPETKKSRENTYALIIANENYAEVASVPMAINDGEIFAQYCEKTLGLPSSNIRKYFDVTYGTFLRSIKDIASIAATYNGEMELIVYYAGHGIPDESTKTPYLLPVDADGTQTEVAISIKDLYAKLESFRTARNIVFLDACFSGCCRGEGMLTSSRGVAIKMKPTEPKGNTIVFSAAADDQTAMPYLEQNHGLFTYYLLKNLKESNGDVTLGDLRNFLTQQVGRQSIVINRKQQTPTVAVSHGVSTGWEREKL